MSKGMNKHHWLIVDDDQDVVSVMSEYLEVHGFSVINCTDPRKLPELIAKYHLAGVICDYVMPFMNGFEVHDLICINEKASIPFIIISGRPDVAYDDRISDEKNTYFFTKPVDLGKLIKIVGRNIKKSILVDPEDYRSLEVEGMVSVVEDNNETVPVVLMEFSSDIMSFEVKRNAIKSGSNYKISLCCDCQGEMVKLKFGGKAIGVKPVEGSNVDEVTFSPDDLDETAYKKIADTYREKQLYINEFLRLAKGLPPA